MAHVTLVITINRPVISMNKKRPLPLFQGEGSFLCTAVLMDAYGRFIVAPHNTASQDIVALPLQRSLPRATGTDTRASVPLE